MASAVELRNQIEEPLLREIANAKAWEYTRALVNADLQPPLLDLPPRSYTVQWHEQLKAAHPDNVVITASRLEDVRYQIAIDASGLEDDVIAEADGTAMWNMILNSSRSGYLDKGVEHIMMGLYVVPPENIVAALAADYREIAEDRLAGYRLTYMIDEGE